VTRLLVVVPGRARPVVVDISKVNYITYIIGVHVACC
jgi:hypothetical protein